MSDPKWIAVKHDYIAAGGPSTEYWLCTPEQIEWNSVDGHYKEQVARFSSMEEAERAANAADQIERLREALLSIRDLIPHATEDYSHQVYIKAETALSVSDTQGES